MKKKFMFFPYPKNGNIAGLKNNWNHTNTMSILYLLSVSLHPSAPLSSLADCQPVWGADKCTREIQLPTGTSSPFFHFKKQ